jgi:hypothetical protein
MIKLTLLVLAMVVTCHSSFSQNFTEGTDLPNTGTGPLFTIGGPNTIIQGTLNTPGDPQDRFQVELPAGCTLTSVTYTMTDVFMITVNGFVQFGVNNQQSLPPLTGSFANGPTGSFPITGPGIFDCMIVANIAANDSWSMIFYNDCPAVTGIDESETTTSLHYFPNPVTDVVNLNFEALGNVVVTISDLQGRILQREETNALSGATSLNYNVEDFAKGIYILQLQNGIETETIRFVKE